MIIELILRAFLLAFLCAIFILTLEAGQWIMAQLEIAWLNAAIVYSTLLIGANILLANIRLTFTGRRDAKASEILLSSIFVFAFVALVISRPASLGVSNWTWTYPYFEIAVAIQASSIGHIISALWPLTTAVQFMAILTAIYAVYLIIAEALDLPVPIAWHRRNNPVPSKSLHQTIYDQRNDIEMLTLENKKLKLETAALNKDASKLSEDLDRAAKREAALHQELVKATMTIELNQKSLMELRNQNKQQLTQIEDLKQSLAEQGELADKNDAYIEKLVQRVKQYQMPGDSFAKDDAGYTEYPDNPFAELARRDAAKQT